MIEYSKANIIYYIYGFICSKAQWANHGFQSADITHQPHRFTFVFKLLYKDSKIHVSHV